MNKKTRDKLLNGARKFIEVCVVRFELPLIFTLK